MDDRQPWMAFFAAATLSKGRDYAYGGAVGKIERTGERLTAKVTGSVPYKVRIELAEQATVPRLGLVAESLSSQCTCPVGFLCKHAAATLFAWCMQAGISLPDPASPEIDKARLALEGDDWDDDEDEDNAPPTARFTAKPPDTKKEDVLEPPQLAVAQPWQGPQAIDADRWLEQLRRLNRPAGDQRLTYHLTQEHGAWFINLVASRRLKNGTLGILKRFDDPEKVLRDRPPYLTSADAALVARIAALTDQGDRWRTSPALSRENGASGDLLAAIMATGKVFFGSFQRPLTSGPALPVTAMWVAQDGGWRLRLRDSQGLDPEIIPVDPPWYVAQGFAGPLASDLPPDVQAAILRMPLLPPALVTAAASDLALAAPDLPPSPITAVALIPIPELVRWTVSLDREPRTWPTTRNPVTLAVVHFRYGDTLVTPQGPRLVRGPDGGPLARDFRAESVRLEELATLGLVPFSEQRLFMGAARWPRSGSVMVHKGAVTAAARPDLPVPIPDGVIAALAAAGWIISGGGDLPAPPLSATMVEAHFDEAEGRDWFSLHLGITVGDERLDLTPVLVRLLEQGEAGLNGLPRFTAEDREWVCLGLPDGRVVRLPIDLLRRLVAHLVELYAAPGGKGWKVEAWQAAALTSIDGMQAESGARMQVLADRLKALGTPVECEPPANCTAVLRPYQKLGLGWLLAIRAAEVGGILADDMGLGKTVQTIAFLATLHPASTRPSLVVCPASMVGTWKRELTRFAPGLVSEILHGNERLKDVAALSTRHILITTYGTCLRDRELLASIPLEALICDEAQALKNAAAKTGDAIRGLDARTRIALTGTPMENHLGELHALLGWLVPGLLGTAARFDQAFRKPIERDGDNARADLLRRRIAPFMLRRTKTAVAPELPPRTEQVVTVELEGAQRALYESVRLAMDDRIRAVLAAKGLGKGHIEILDALLKLRQCCCDPRLVKLPGAQQATTEAGSAKLTWLNETLPELVEEGRRILVFSQFTSYLDLIESDVLRPSGIPFLRLDGSTTNRDVLVQGFQAGEAPVFLLSLKAGGTGLTLTAADTVIFCDPWWNPAAEAQAADRAHRIGQDKPVFIWRLVASGTVEERILAMQDRKRALLDNILDADGQAVPGFDEADLAALLAPLP